jgi:hypothetical protein
VRAAIRLKHYSIRTEEVYVQWVKRFVRFHNKRHPNELGAAEVAAVLTHLAVAAHGSASARNQARAALLFLHREVSPPLRPGAGSPRCGAPWIARRPP